MRLEIMNLSLIEMQNPAFGPSQIRALTEIFVAKSIQVIVAKE